MRQLLIIGSGFHKQVNASCNPLNSWWCLLQRLCGKAGGVLTACPRKEPTLFWEELVVHRASAEARKVSDCEQDLRRMTWSVLEAEVKGRDEHYTGDPTPASVREFVINHRGHVVNLNFDDLAYSAFDRKTPKAVKLAKNPFGLKDCRLSDRYNLQHRTHLYVDGKPVGSEWHPHGSLKRQDSLRLGLRDYGAYIGSFTQAFSAFKAWERKVVRGSFGKRGKITNVQYEQACHALDELDNQSDNLRKYDAHDTWITRFMLLPVTIIGAGLSQGEIGLHWLLAQRARNLARVREDDRPKVSMFGSGRRPSPFIDKWIPVGSGGWSAAWERALHSRP